MRDLFQRVTALFKPLASQKNRGPGSVQAAKLNGNVHVHNIRTTHVHLAVHPPDRPSEKIKPTTAAPARKARPDQAEAVSQYKLLTPTERNGVHNFMLREFETSIILELNEDQTFRLVKYIQACIERRSKGKTVHRKSNKAW